MTAGAQLQRARHERKLSLADVTEKTKIQPWVLEALERDRLPELMSAIYVKGFLSTYARFLRLDAQALVQQLTWPQPQPAQQELPPAPARPAPAPPAARAPRQPVRLPRIPAIPWATAVRALRLAVATGAVVGLIVINPLRWIRPIHLPKLQLPKIAAAPARWPKHAKAATKQAKAPRPVKAAEAANAPAASLASVAPVSEPMTLPAPAAPAVSPVQALELSVSASRTTWIRVRADGKLLTQQRLSRGSQERWTAQKQFELIVSKPSQVELALNGHSISPFLFAHHGRLLITRQGITGLPEP